MPDETTPAGDASGNEDPEIAELADVLAGLYEENTDDTTDKPADATGEGEPPPDASPSDGDTSDSTSDTQSPPSQSPDWSSPEAQQFLDKWYADRRAAEERQAASTKSLEELEALVAEERYDELGERFAKEFQEAKAKRTVGEATLREFLTETYKTIFADPVFQNLTDAEKVELDPNKFSSDAEYINFLRQFSAKKASTAASDAAIEERVNERLKALANERRGATVGSPSATGLPAADSGRAPSDDTSRPAGDLLAEGMREAYARVRGLSDSD